MKTNDKKVTGYAVDKSNTDGDIEVINFTKDMPYILDLTPYTFEFGKIKNILKDIQFLIKNKIHYIIIYRMGLPESSLTQITNHLAFFKPL